MKLTFTITLCLLAMLRTYSQNYCIPQTQAFCCGYGIVNVTLPNINNSTANASEGYQNFSTQITSGTEGTAFPVSITTGGTEPHDVRIWLDANNDGTFQHPQEMVFESLHAINPNGFLNLPNSILFNDTLRLRITADYAGSEPLPCSNPSFGQTEDYSFILFPAGELPVAGFSASVTNTCNGVVLFTSQSTGNPSAYLWNFGDGHTSTEPIYTHTYAQDGTYDITLTVSNSLGADTLLMEEYITVALSETCDTFAIPFSGNISVLYNCNFVLTDNGRTANYSDYSNGYITLSPLWAQQVCLHFTEFNTEQQFDYIEVYDGPSPAAPYLGRYSGNTLPPDICSTGPALCIKQCSDDVVNYSGFVAQAHCTMGVSDNNTYMPISISPNPFTDGFNISFPTETTYTASLISITGQVIITKNITSANHYFSLANLPVTAGVYVLYIQADSDTWQQKIIKLDP